MVNEDVVKGRKTPNSVPEPDGWSTRCLCPWRGRCEGARGARGDTGASGGEEIVGGGGRKVVMVQVVKESSTLGHRLGTKESKGDECNEVQGGEVKEASMSSGMVWFLYTEPTVLQDPCSH